MPINLAQETRQAIASSYKKPEDIIFIGSVGISEPSYACTWDEFLEIANYDYVPDGTVPAVAHDLIVAFADGSWLERGGEDFTERWEFRGPLHLPQDTRKLEKVFAENGGFETVHEIYVSTKVQRS